MVRLMSTAPTSARRGLLIVIFTALIAILSACGDNAVDCSGPTAAAEVRLANNVMDPATVSACEDQRMTLTMQVEQAGIVSIAGYPNQSLELIEGDTAVFDFTANQAGTFAITWKADEGATAIEVGELVVSQ